MCQTQPGSQPAPLLCQWSPPTPLGPILWTQIHRTYYTRLTQKWIGYQGAHHGPGLGKTRPHFWLIAADQWGLNWKNLVYEESSVYDVPPCYRGHRFRKHAQISDQCGPNGPLRKSKRIGPTANPPPPALYTARDQKLIGMLTGRRGEVGREAPRPDFWRKIIKKSVKTSFFEVISEVQKDSEDISTGIGIFL